VIERTISLDKANTSLKQLSLKEDLQNQSATNGDGESEQSHNDEQPANTTVDSQIEPVRLDDIAIESIARYPIIHSLSFFFLIALLLSL
jgi:hypothetical protein